MLHLPENSYFMGHSEDSLYHAGGVYRLRFDWVVLLIGRKKGRVVPKNL
jgi:hypothetical protein